MKPLKTIFHYILIFFGLLALAKFGYTQLPTVQDIQPPPQEPFQVAYFSLDGAWLPAEDPVKVGVRNYTKLKNLRYIGDAQRGTASLEGVHGYSKINLTAVTGYPDIENGIHFKKTNPQESHLLFWAKTSGATASGVYKNDTAIPDQGEFSGITVIHADSSSVDRGRLSLGPANHVFYANGEEELIWGGDEVRVAFFVTDTSSVTQYLHDPKDYTKAVQNTLDDSANVAVIGGGNDNYTKLLLHFDGTDGSTTITDSSAGSHSVSAVTNAQLDTDQAKFGTASAIFDGSSGITIPDSDDWAFGTDPFTIDFWGKFNSTSGTQGLFGQSESGASTALTYSDTNVFSSTDSMFVDLVGEKTISTDTWYHIAIVRGYGNDSDQFAIFVDGDVIDTFSGVTSWKDYSGVFDIGSNRDGDGNSFYFNGWIDEFRISKGIARWTSSFNPPTRHYSSGNTVFLVGFPRPISGVSVRVKDANPLSGQTVTFKEWNGSSWTSILDSGTTEGTQGLAQSGKIEWGSTVNTSKPKYIQGKVYYWYQGELSAGDATISNLTVISPIQELKDIWDQVHRNVISVQKYDGGTDSYEDVTLEALSADYIDFDIGGMDSSDYLLIMSEVRLMGLYFEVASGNTTAATSGASVYYHNGDGYAVLGGSYDGTSDLTGLKPFYQSGALTWNPPEPEEEFAKEMFGEFGYVYLIRWDGTLDSAADEDGTEIEAVYGIPAPLELEPCKFTVPYKRRILRCGFPKSNQGNRIDFSKTDAPDVHNGEDSSNDTKYSIYVGDGEDLTAAIELFNTYGNDVTSGLVIGTAVKTYMLFGSTKDDFVVNEVSPNFGMPAPMTLTLIEGYQVIEGIRRNSAAWLSYTGPVIFDGVIPRRITGLENYFDPNDDDYVGTTAIENASAGYDATNNEWNLVVGNYWFVLNLDGLSERDPRKWYPKDVGTAPLPQSFIPVTDTNGNKYLYSGVSNGYLMRLENGNTWDGNAIDFELETGDFSPVNNQWYESDLRRVRLDYKVISEAATVEIAAYEDSSTSGTTIGSVALNSGAYRLERKVLPHPDLTARLFRLNMSGSVSGTTKGFQPQGFGYQYRQRRLDDGARQ